jgi:hypothetical protein
MIKDLVSGMSTDMGISRYHGETEESFTFRVCYSALGQWCLRTAQSISEGNVGVTKHSQTLVLNTLLTRFSDLFPYLAEAFMLADRHQVSLSVFIRRVYEETGYLISDNSNRNRLANFGRGIQVGTRSLFFGLPGTSWTANGLGVYTDSSAYSIPVKEFLIRDDLTCEEYLQSRYDPIDFHDRDLDLRELEFFQPQWDRTPSQSWGTRPATECTVARGQSWGPSTEQ